MIRRIMKSLFKKDRPILGIDIASESIKVLEIQARGDEYKVESYYALPIDPSMATEGKLVDISGVGDILSRAIKLAGAKSKEAAIAIPRSLAITKVIEYDDTIPLKDVESEIKQDAESLIPHKLEEVSYDFTLIRHRPEAGMNDYLLAATLNENIEERIDVLSAAGLTPSIVDLESYAIQNAFTLITPDLEGYTTEAPDVAVALFDIGAKTTTLFVLVNGQTVFTRDQPFGGSIMTSRIAQLYDINLKEADELKLSAELPKGYEEDILEPFRDELLQTINRSIQFYLSASHSGIDVKHIVLSGGCGSTTGLVDHAERQLGIPTIIANPLKRMTFSKGVNIKSVEKASPALMIACGLAMRSNSYDKA